MKKKKPKTKPPLSQKPFSGIGGRTEMACDTAWLLFPCYQCWGFAKISRWVNRGARPAVVRSCGVTSKSHWNHRAAAGNRKGKEWGRASCFAGLYWSPDGDFRLCPEPFFTLVIGLQWLVHHYLFFYILNIFRSPLNGLCCEWLLYFSVVLGYVLCKVYCHIPAAGGIAAPQYPSEAKVAFCEL